MKTNRSGIILAGGRGTRMGPLAAQISKALVPIGQRPHLIHQLDLMWESGIKDLIVVVSPDTGMQVGQCLHRCGWNGRVNLVIQQTPRGPVDAMAVGLTQSKHDNTVVLMSDTYIDSIPHVDGKPWVGVAPAVTARSFCYPSTELGAYIDGHVEPGNFVTVGVYEFNTTEAFVAASHALHAGRAEPEVPMSAFLNLYDTPAQNVDIPSWLDIGDIESLAAARKRKFITRDYHDLRLVEPAIITKAGSGEAFIAQVNRMTELEDAFPTMVPRILALGTSSYSMEYIDLPTLSELFLYWPGRPDTWAAILKNVVKQMERIWSHGYECGTYPADEVENLFVGKAIHRISGWDGDESVKSDAINALSECRGMFSDSRTVYAHGDLNWNNILYSLNTGMFKLVDPRGDKHLPLTYEIAKLAYSYDAGFAAITHDLTMRGVILPERDDETAAMNAVLHQYVGPAELQIAQGCLMLAAVPLHSERQANALMRRGMDMITDV